MVQLQHNRTGIIFRDIVVGITQAVFKEPIVIKSEFTMRKVTS